MRVYFKFLTFTTRFTSLKIKQITINIFVQLDIKIPTSGTRQEK